MDNTERLCWLLFGRADKPGDWVGGNEARMLSDAADEIERLREHIDAAKALAAKQAEDAGLWFNARTVTEAYLQGALRDLAAIVEEPNKKYTSK